MKAYTDLEQSKKLAEILPIESADMHYNNVSIRGINYVDEYRAELMEYNRAIKILSKYTINPLFEVIPCWSLTALLDIFPCSKESPIVNLTRGGWNPSFTRQWFATWEDEDKNIFYSCDGISPVDAVVELILKLHEKKNYYDYGL